MGSPVAEVWDRSNAHEKFLLCLLLPVREFRAECRARMGLVHSDGKVGLLEGRQDVESRRLFHDKDLGLRQMQGPVVVSLGNELPRSFDDGTRIDVLFRPGVTLLLHGRLRKCCERFLRIYPIKFRTNSSKPAIWDLTVKFLMKIR